MQTLTLQKITTNASNTDDEQRQNTKNTDEDNGEENNAH